MAVKKPSKVKRPAPVHLEDRVYLRVQRGPDSSGRWYWSCIENNGKETRLFSGWGTAATMAAEYQKRKDEGSLHQTKPKKAPTIQKPTTIGELMERWYQASIDDPEIAAKSLIRRKSTKDLVINRIGTIALNGFDFNQQENFRKGFLSDYSDHSYNAMLQGLKQAWKWGLKHGWGPFSDLTISRIAEPEHEREKYTPTKDELDRITEYLLGAPWIKATFTFCRMTGVRIGELSSIAWNKIDLTNRKMEINGKTGKRIFPINNKLHQFLLDWKFKGEHTNNIWGVTEKTITSELNEKVMEACSEAGIQHRITIHSLRRYFIKRLRKANTPLKVGAELLGHSIKIQMEIYSEIEEEELHSAMSALDDSAE